jgi:DNA-binding transcriptional MerR regulator
MSHNSQDEKKFTIEEVAKRIDRSVHTIGRWQKEGFITPEYKTVNGRIARFFSENDIKKLEEVRELKLGIMLSGKGEGAEK